VKKNEGSIALSFGKIHRLAEFKLGRLEKKGRLSQKSRPDKRRKAGESLIGILHEIVRQEISKKGVRTALRDTE